MKKAFVFLFVLFSTGLFAQEAEIPLDPIRMPSDDLIFEGRVLRSEEAWELQNRAMNPVDLSKLDPKESSLWSNKILSTIDPSMDKIPLADGERVDFNGVIGSNSGMLRFNVTPEDQNNKRVFTIMLMKDLHTALLRKNLLRKLGYIIPKMQYMKKLSVSFEKKSELLFFINRELPENALGAPGRWIDRDVLKRINDAVVRSYKELVEKGEIKPEDLEESAAWTNQDVINNTVIEEKDMTLPLQDVVALMPLASDHYNTATGLPPERLTARTLRSLIIPYSILHIGESINKVDWFVGSEDNRTIKLPHFTMSDFDTTVDDAQWILRRLLKFDRSDFEEIVREAYFPAQVGKLVLEKIISRRNSVVKIFEMKEPELKYDVEISDGEELKKGSLTKEDWDGYASRFAHGEPDSPFQDFGFFLLAKLQSAVMDSLTDEVNTHLSFFNPNEERLKFHQEQFEDGLNHFVETGEFKEFGIGTWVSPYLDGTLIANRDIVIGNYLGTDNVVQLADTFGVAVSGGIHLGIENIPQLPTAFVRGGISALKTYTHLKPVKTLKQTFKEPYQNIIVPLVKLKLKSRLKKLSRLGDEQDGNEEQKKEREKIFKELIEKINKTLGVGESLIITEKLTPSVLAQGSYNLMETKFTLGGGVDYGIVRRLHLYRKDADTIQVYDDFGRGMGLSLTAAVDSYIPVLRLSHRNHNGQYKVRVYDVNINPDLEENPDLYRNANALYQVLSKNSTELLQQIKNPYKIKNKFKDRINKFSFLVWRAKYLKGNSLFTVETPAGDDTHYISVKEEYQEGINYEAFVKDVANYYLAKYLGEWGIQLGVDRYKNPAHTLYGISETSLARYEGRLFPEEGVKEQDLPDMNTENPFISITNRKEGWSKSTEKMRKAIKGINQKYNKVLFNNESFRDARKLKLWNIDINMNIYEDGVANIQNLRPEVLEKIQTRYKKERYSKEICKRNSRVFRHRRGMQRSPRQQVECGNLGFIIDKLKFCKKDMHEGDAVDKAKCTLKVAILLERYLDFPDFKDIVGEGNYYLFGTIGGFRTESETLADPINSNTMGEVAGDYWDGPVRAVRSILGVQQGEFYGSWIREIL